MALLGRDEGTAKKLLQDLNKEGYFDGLPVKLRERFIQSVMQALPWMRNSLGAHGQGVEAVEVPHTYAELATDLAAAFNHFLIALDLDGKQSPSSDVRQAPIGDFSGLPGFLPPGKADDDIPF